MNRIKTMLIIGFVFIACGLTFLIVGLSTHLLVFTALGPSFMGLGVVFLATSKVQARFIQGSDRSGVKS